MLFSRRELIKAGVVGQLLLGLGSLNASVVQRVAYDENDVEAFLTPDDRKLFSLLIPYYLGDAWSFEQNEEATLQVVNAIQEVILGLTPSVQAEMRQLLDMLAIKPLRYLLTGIYHLEKAEADEMRNWLNAWKGSRVRLFRTAYLGLQQPIMGAWYGQPRSWQDIGYPGPPPIVRS